MKGCKLNECAGMAAPTSKANLEAAGHRMLGHHLPRERSYSNVPPPPHQRHQHQRGNLLLNKNHFVAFEWIPGRQFRCWFICSQNDLGFLVTRRFTYVCTRKWPVYVAAVKNNFTCESVVKRHKRTRGAVLSVSTNIQQKHLII
jgi:hypothetical protein